MKIKLIIAAFLVAICNHLYAQNLVWLNTLGSQTQTSAEEVVQDKNGNTFIIGSFRGTVDFDPGIGVSEVSSSTKSGFLIKLTSDGIFSWVKTWEQTVNSIAFDDADNIYVVGGSNHMYIYKFATTGNLVWEKKIPYFPNEATDIKIVNNKLYVVGAFANTISFTIGNTPQTLTSNNTSRDIFAMKADTSGNILWMKQMGGNDDDRALCVDNTTDGKLVIGGYYRGTADFDPGPGVYNLTSINVDEAFVTQIDTNGNFIWANGFIGNGGSFLNDLVIDSNNNIYCAGEFSMNIDFDPGPGVDLVTSNGATDIFYLKLSSNGNVIWRRAIGGGSNDNASNITIDAVGRLIVSGNFSSSNMNFDPGVTNYTRSINGASNIYILNSDLNGNFLNAGFLTGTSSIKLSSLNISTSGGFFLSGSYNYCGNGCDFDPGVGTRDVNGITGITVWGFYGYYDNNIIPLPLDILRIDAKKLSQSNQIIWETDEQSNIHRFDIEASSNGIVFEKIDELKPNRDGSLINHFEYSDINDLRFHQQTFYRIKVVDFENQIRYSKVVSLSKTNDGNNGIAIYPILTKDCLNLRGVKPTDKIYIKDLHGSNIKFSYINASQNTINTSKMSPGMYLLCIQRPDGSIITKKFTKL